MSEVVDRALKRSTGALYFNASQTTRTGAGRERVTARLLRAVCHVSSEVTGLRLFPFLPPSLMVSSLSFALPLALLVAL